jgi:hypothetical protein
MTRNYASSSAWPKTSGRGVRRTVAAAFAMAMVLVPVSASGMDSTPRLALDSAGHLLPLPAISYLESVRWMTWKPRSPLFKTDILLLPDNIQPGSFQLPSEHERSLPRVS